MQFDNTEYRTFANPVCRYVWGDAAGWLVFLYLKTVIQKLGKSCISVPEDKDTQIRGSRMSIFLGPEYEDCVKNVFQYFGIHASMYESPAHEPDGFPYIKLAFGCFSPIWPTKR